MLLSPVSPPSPSPPQAALYYEWAALELAGGNQFKALGVLAKGLKEHAAPARCARLGLTCRDASLARACMQQESVPPGQSG